MTGSVSDHQALIRALDRYDLAERTADLLRTREGWSNSHAYYFPLIAAARACGWSIHGSETAYAFAKRRVATFERVCPNHTADARRAA